MLVRQGVFEPEEEGLDILVLGVIHVTDIVSRVWCLGNVILGKKRVTGLLLGCYYGYWVVGVVTGLPC